MDNRCTRNHKIYNTSLIHRNKIILNSNNKPCYNENPKKLAKFVCGENSKKIIEKKMTEPEKSAKKNMLLA